MVPEPLPYTLRGSKFDRIAPGAVVMLLGLLPWTILVFATVNAERDGAFPVASRVALLVGGAVTLAATVVFARRVFRSAVIVHPDRLEVRNIRRSNSIPFADIQEIRGVVVTASGAGRSAPDRIDVHVHHGGQTTKLAAASKFVDDADEFQEPLWVVLEQLAPKYSFKVTIP